MSHALAKSGEAEPGIPFPMDPPPKLTVNGRPSSLLQRLCRGTPGTWIGRGQGPMVSPTEHIAMPSARVGPLT